MQGVGYRWSCLQRAEEVGAAGWVRNLPDGRVEAWIEGDDEAVEQLLAWCRQGPRWGQVDRVEAREAGPRGFSGFEVR
ncbi:acylphosphatase [Luteococcus peritonei]